MPRTVSFPPPSATRCPICATTLDCPTPLFSATLPIYAATLAMGMGGEDTAAVHAVLGRMAGIERKG